MADFWGGAKEYSEALPDEVGVASVTLRFMGLDVYLCYYPSLELREKEIEYLKRDDELWKELTSGDFNTLSEKEKWERTSSYGDRLCVIATELGLGTVVDQDLGEGHKPVLLDSAHYRDHSFKIGYYRSGYFGGFNSVTNAAIGKTLYWFSNLRKKNPSSTA